MRTAAGESILIFGALKLDQTNFLKNSLIIENRNQDAVFYDKAKLVPFGEYLPFIDLMSYFKISERSNLFGWGFKKGNGPELLNLTNGLKFIPLICYEAIFPNFLKPSVKNADFILQITNDAWFGKSIGPQQHLAQLRIRAIEYGLPVIRVANTGITAIIDANGKVVENLAVNKSGFLDSFIPSRKKSTVYGLFGDLIFLLLILLVVTVAFIVKKFIKRFMLIALTFNSYSFGHVYQIHLHSSSIYWKLFITNLTIPKRFKKLFYVVLKFRSTFFLPFYSILRYPFIYKFSTNVVEFHSVGDKAFLNFSNKYWQPFVFFSKYFLKLSTP